MSRLPRQPRASRLGTFQNARYATQIQPPQLVTFELFECAAILLKPFDHIEFHEVKVLDDL
jgi:hypothetical protein